MRNVSIIVLVLSSCVAFASLGCSGASAPEPSGPSEPKRARVAAPDRPTSEQGSRADALAEQERQERKVNITDEDYNRFEQEAKAAYENLPPPSDSGENSVPIKQRAVIVVNDSTTGSANPAQFRLIDRGMKLLFDLGLKRGYGKIVYLGEGEATWASFVDGVGKLAKDPDVAVVDALINLHGGPSVLVFNDREVPTEQIGADLTRAVPDDVYYKLRVVYNQACFGESHSQGFLDGGFLSVAGTRGIHNAGFVDWPKFVSTWGFGGTFGESVARTTLGGIASTIMQWFGGEGVDNGWILDGEPNVMMDSILQPPAK